MKLRRKLTGLCRTLLLAASVTAISVSAAAQDLAELNQQILENPQDSALNLRYARAAEDAGHLRLALAAYERVLINEPDNRDARRGYERVRRMIEPAFTTLRTEFGARWDSNATNSAVADEEAYSIFANATLIDERALGATRWRSSVAFEGEITPDVDQLNYGYLGAQTGPLLYAAPHLAFIPSLGAGVAMLDGAYYYNEVHLGATMEGKRDGLSYWTRARAGWRSHDEDSTADEGPFAELIGGLSVPRVGSDNGTLVFVPWARWSEVEGSTFTFFSGETAPGEFVEYGIDVAYTYRLNDHVTLSGGAVLRQRDYTQTVILGQEREDTFIAPEVAMSVQNFMPCECGVKVSYRHRDNDSNDPSADFDAQQVSLSLLRRF